MFESIEIIAFDKSKHNISEMTQLIRSAYKRLGDMGLRYWATWQEDKDTLKRAEEGLCFIALSGESLLGTITYRPASAVKGCPWYDRPDVSSCGQFAVWPERQRQGVGSLLMIHVEKQAKVDGAAELAIDTAEQASHLISMYKRRNYRFIEFVSWDITNYRSVVMSKKLNALND